jgi:hypothetical protein
MKKQLAFSIVSMNLLMTFSPNVLAKDLYKTSYSSSSSQQKQTTPSYQQKTSYGSSNNNYGNQNYTFGQNKKPIVPQNNFPTQNNFPSQNTFPSQKKQEPKYQDQKQTINTQKQPDQRIQDQRQSNITQKQPDQRYQDQKRDLPKLSDMQKGDTRTRKDNSVDTKIKGGYVNTKINNKGETEQRHFKMNGELKKTVVIDHATGNKKVFNADKSLRYTEQQSKTWYGRPVINRSYTSYSNSRAVQNNYYVTERHYHGYNYGYYTPGALFADHLLTAMAVTAIYSSALNLYASPYSVPVSYWSSYQCNIVFGCYWRPRTVVYYPYQTVSDQITASYYQDLHDRVVANNAVDSYKREIDQAQTQRMQQLEQKMQSEIDRKVQEAIRDQKQNLASNSNGQNAALSADDNEIPNSLKRGKIVLVHKRMLVNDLDTKDDCSVVEGDVLKIVEHNEESSKADDGSISKNLVSTLEVMKAAPRKASCEIGKQVTVDFDTIIEMENAFQHKVEEGLAKANKEKLITSSK